MRWRCAAPHRCARPRGGRWRGAPRPSGFPRAPPPPPGCDRRRARHSPRRSPGPRRFPDPHRRHGRPRRHARRHRGPRRPRHPVRASSCGRPGGRADPRPWAWARAPRERAGPCRRYPPGHPSSTRACAPRHGAWSYRPSGTSQMPTGPVRGVLDRDSRSKELVAQRVGARPVLGGAGSGPLLQDGGHQRVQGASGGVVTGAAAHPGRRQGFEQITSIIAILFGYSNFEQLVNDPQVNNETIDNLLGVLYNADTLSEQIYRTLANDKEVLEHFDPSFLYDYFDEHPQLKLLTQDALDDVAQSFVENGWYELLDHEGVISVMADTNIIYDEVVDIVFNDSVLDEHGYKASFLVTIEGYERREASVRGLLPISIRAAVRAPLILGQTGLGRLSFEDIKAEVVWPE